MSTPTNAALLQSFERYAHISELPSYVITYMTPGGVGDLHAGLSFRRASLVLDKMEPISNWGTLQRIHEHLVYFEQPLETHNPEWKTNELRNDKEVYLYPKCPRGYPVEKLHCFAFQGDEEKIAKFDALREELGTWFGVFESGRISRQERDQLFRVVSAPTHGTSSDFLRRWLKLHREFSTKKEPVLFAIEVHDLILRHMPYVRGNRRLARLLLCHTIAKCGIYPPMFWSGIGYETKTTKSTYSDLLSLEEKRAKLTNLAIQGTPKKELVELEFEIGNLQAKAEEERKAFLHYILALSDEAASLYQKQPPARNRPLEGWEIMALGGDLKSALFSYLYVNRRVLVADAMVALSIFANVRGGQTLWVQDQKEGHHYWHGTSLVFGAAVEALVTEGHAKWVPTEAEEYEAARLFPSFDTGHKRETWKPAVLVFVPDNN